MRYGIFSDIHGNLEAFEAVLAACRQEAIDKFFCLGDIVGYGADPQQCIAEVRSLNAITVAGNHDRAVVDLFDKEYFNPYALEAIVWTKGVLNDFEKDFLRNLPLQHSEETFMLAHAGPEDPGRFLYLFEAEDVSKSFAEMKRPICFVGHTHIPRTFILQGGRVSLCEKEKFQADPRALYICNIGSVGQPRDNNPEAAYCIFDSKKMLVEIKRIGYNINRAQAKIREAGLSEFLAARLSQGR